MKYAAREYQRRAERFVVEHPRCALWLDMGLGKTVATATAIGDLQDMARVGRALIVAPKRVARRTWPAEFRKWDHLSGIDWARLDAEDFGLQARVVLGRRRGLEVADPRRTRTRLREKIDAHSVLIVSIDFFPWLVKLLGSKHWPFGMIVLDESSLLKNRDTERFKAARHIAQAAERVVELTGTPATQGLMGLWSQAYLLDLGERLGPTITGFRDRFFVPGRRGPAGMIYDYKPKPGAREEIAHLMSDITLSMSADDWLTLPERIDNVIDVELPAQARRQYDEMERQALTEVGKAGEVAMAANAAVVVNKLIQIASGSVFDDAGRAHPVHEAKLEALDELLESTEGNVLCFYGFEPDRERLLARYPFARPIDGRGVQDAWDRGEVRMMVAHPSSAGHGLNLQEGGDTVVWFTVPHSAELYRQANRRLHRPGQASDRVVVNHLVSANTIEETVLDRVRGRVGEEQTLMDLLQARIPAAGGPIAPRQVGG